MSFHSAGHPYSAQLIGDTPENGATLVRRDGKVIVTAGDAAITKTVALVLPSPPSLEQRLLNLKLRIGYAASSTAVGQRKLLLRFGHREVWSSTFPNAREATVIKQIEPAFAYNGTGIALEIEVGFEANQVLAIEHVALDVL